MTPRPGESVGTDSATLRPKSDSIGSLRRSSSLVPNASRIAGRISAQRPAVTTRWTPWCSPAAAISVQILGQLLVVAQQRRPVVDHQQHVGGLLGRQVAGPATLARFGHRVDPELAEARLALVDHRADLADRGAHALGIALAGDAAEVGCGSERTQQTAAEVQRVGAQLRWTVGDHQRRRAASAAACSCRSGARRSTARWPPTPARSSANGSWRCSDGRSSRPMHARRPDRTADAGSDGCDHHAGLSSTSDSGWRAGSGSSHTWCTRAPTLRRPQALDQHVELGHARFLAVRSARPREPLRPASSNVSTSAPLRAARPSSYGVVTSAVLKRS